MELSHLCRQIISDIENVLKTEALTFADNPSNSNHYSCMTAKQDDVHSKLAQWTRCIESYLEQCFDHTVIVQEVSALVLTSTPIMNKSTSQFPLDNRTAENIYKLTTLIQPNSGLDKSKDFSAKYAREELKFLFIDISLGKHEDVQLVNITIQFVNQLIGHIERMNDKLAVFDMRAPQFLAEKELLYLLGNYSESYRLKKPEVNESNRQIEDLQCAYLHRLGDPCMWIDHENLFDVRVKQQLEELIKLGYQLDKLYYRPLVGLKELVRQIENDTVFSELRVQTKYKRNIAIRDHLPGWLRTIRDDFIDKFYADLDLNSIEMIVVGSSGVDYPTMRYNSLRALVAESWFTTIPPAVVTFVNYLNKALCVEMVRGAVEKDNPKYDFQCRQLMGRVLFINVCHSSSHGNDAEWANAVCSIKLINMILQKLDGVKQVALLDFRMPLHADMDNLRVIDVKLLLQNLRLDLDSLEWKINPSEPKRSTFDEIKQEYIDFLTKISLLRDTLCQDMTTRMANYYHQSEECFRLVNPNSFHRYVRLGNPGKLHYFEYDENYCVQQLRQLHNEGFPIDKLFVP